MLSADEPAVGRLGHGRTRSRAGADGTEKDEGAADAVARTKDDLPDVMEESRQPATLGLPHPQPARSTACPLPPSRSS
jgi:hypothetical protein